jgi:Icc-related predicted phosphoesterase
MAGGRLLAISDLHVGYRANHDLLAGLWPGSPADWLIVAGDVAERIADVTAALKLLSERFAQVIWVPGNHELWTIGGDRWALRGEERYLRLVEECRALGVITPEDDYPVWEGPSGAVRIAPLFLLYDYSFRADGTMTKDEALARAYDSGVVCTDEMLLHPDPYATIEEWCEARVKDTEHRLAGLDPRLPLVLVNHYPLVRAPTRVLRYQEFAPWCGTERTANWHRRFNTVAVVYGHLHIRRTTWHDAVPFMEVSVGYPRERSQQGDSIGPCEVLPAGIGDTGAAEDNLSLPAPAKPRRALGHLVKER